MSHQDSLTSNVVAAARKVVAAWFAQEDDEKIKVDEAIVDLSEMLNDLILYECVQARTRAFLIAYGESARVARETSNERNKKAAEKPKKRTKR